MYSSSSSSSKPTSGPRDLGGSLRMRLVTGGDESDSEEETTVCTRFAFTI